MKYLLSVALAMAFASVNADEKPDAPPKAIKKLSFEEKRAIAKQRLADALKERKRPFDRVKAVRNVIFKKYKIDVKKLFTEEKLQEVKSGNDLRKVFGSLKTAVEVETILDSEAAKAIEPNWPEEQLEKVKKVADEKFKAFKIGEVVEVKIKLPNGTTRTIKDRLGSISGGSITLGANRIPFQDLSYPAKWAFDPKAVSRRKNAYIYNVYTRAKAEDKAATKGKMATAAYKKYGCVKVGKKWVSIKRLFVKEIEPSLDELEKEHDRKETERLAQEIYLEMLNEGLLTK